VIWAQREITLAPRPRGFHLITREVLEALPELGSLEVGLLHLLIRHTSASLALNEDASPDVRRAFEAWSNEHRDRGGSRSLVATAWGEAG
jgi:thiamine phosphate synthase YjbQ (UPF0047 family)